MDTHSRNANEHPAGPVKAQKGNMHIRRKIFYSLLATLGVVLALIVGRYVHVMFVNPMSAFDKPNTRTPSLQTPVQPDMQQAASAPEASPTPSPTLSPEEELQRAADAEFMKNKVNILLLGWDQSPEREEEGSELYRDEANNFRSDVIMLLTVDFETKRVDLISIPRDTYAPIYNTKGRWKINAAFAKGGSAEGEGFEYAMHTVSDLLGVPIAYYAGVDMVGLKAVVDAMGGISYDVDVEIRLNGRVLEKGYQHLDGQQVLDYCRARKGISTDVGRADRQQRMLFAIFEQLQSRNQLVHIPKIYASVADKVRTNLNTEQIAALAVVGMGLDMQTDLKRHTLQGSYVNNVYNASFYVLNGVKLKALIKEVFGVDITLDKQYDLNYVHADKTASAAMSYVEGAEYLLKTFGRKANGADALQRGMEELRTLADRAIAVSSGGDDGELDPEAIESAQLALYSAMLAYCEQNGITQEDVSRRKLPDDIYTAMETLHIQQPTPQPDNTQENTKPTPPSSVSLEANG